MGTCEPATADVLFTNRMDAGLGGEGELEKLKADSNATPLDYAASAFLLEGKEYALDCNCWHERASRVVQFVDDHSFGIARYLNGEQKRAVEVAKAMPTVGS